MGSENDKPRRKKKKDKKDKKKKGKDREKERESRKQRDIDRQVRLAERIASKRSPVRRSPEYKADLWEHEKYDRERNPGRRAALQRKRTPTGYFGAKITTTTGVGVSRGTKGRPEVQWTNLRGTSMRGRGF